jgi:hypothetical protein
MPERIEIVKIVQSKFIYVLCHSMFMCPGLDLSVMVIGLM